MRSWVRELVLFVIPLLKSDENSQIVLSRCHLDAGSSKLCGKLIEASGCESLLRTINIEGRDGWMMRRLLREI